jgi:tetratricopeptide (TPR) repeat protein
LYLEAIDYYDRALGIQMKLGCDDAQLAMARVLVGSVQYYLGRYNKSLNLFEEALRVLLQQVGPEHETVAATLFHMGVARAAQADYDMAMSNLKHALGIQTKLLGRQHPATLRTRREIGNVKRDARMGDALEEFHEILECQKLIHGEKHPNIAETLHSLGCSQAQSGDVQQALKTFQDAYNMRLPFLGPEHPHQATTLVEIAKIQCKRGSKKSSQKAMRFIETALSIRMESLSEQHIDVALAVATKGSCLVASGLFADANKQFLDALPVARAAVGENHPSVAWIHVQMGIMHLRKCHFDDAKESINTALRIYRACYSDDDHPVIQDAMQELERVERAELLCV